MHSTLELLKSNYEHCYMENTIFCQPYLATPSSPYSSEVRATQCASPPSQSITSMLTPSRFRFTSQQNDSVVSRQVKKSDNFRMIPIPTRSSPIKDSVSSTSQVHHAFWTKHDSAYTRPNQRGQAVLMKNWLFLQEILLDDLYVNRSISLSLHSSETDS